MRVLIVDDERHIRDSLKKYLGLEHIDAEGAETGEAALEALEKEPFDAVVLDLKLPGISGQEVLERMLRRGLPSPTIMISAHGEIADAVAALKAGARDYLVKPFDPAELVIKLRSLVEDKRRENLVEAGKRTGSGETALIGETGVMRALSAQIDKIAGSNVTVLLSGESGTGKEVAARQIHRRGPLSTEPFVAVNIGGIHEGLMESELFGHEKGAFTGAVARKSGLFELAGRGCLFLDEIGEMPMPLQVKLLRVIQERKIRRLGGTGDIPVNARIISATNRDPEALVREGRFREDLYYRLNVFRLILPPLRERSADIPLLARYLLGKLAARMGKPAPALGPDAEEKLRAYSFPGNVRELENILERALIFCGGKTIRGHDIDLHRETSASPGTPGTVPPAPAASPKPAPPPWITEGDGRSLEELEKEAIFAALTRSGGNRTRAAGELGVSRKTILNKLRSYGIS
jgi:two-component system response regulator AtoC